MRGRSAHKAHAAHRAHGGSAGGDVKEPGGPIKGAGGNPYVEEEGESKTSKVERKHGGKAKRARGGKIEGHAARHHLGKPGRKRGGRVGADLAPLSSASRPASIGKQAPTQSSAKSPD
jgi:hypothetical protein